MNGMKLTDGARMAMSSLNAAGYECYAVGGCVRDWLLRRPGHDVDLATDAHVEDMHHVFEAVGIEVFDTGAEHGTITALVGQEPIEITTFRIDGAYSDRRHPDSVSFSDDIVEDLARRDFTVNAMAYHPETGLIDPFGGQEDLKHHIIRCVGDPNKRFEEDSLRILRAVRFASQLSFEIDEATTQALNDKRLLLADVSVERVAKELIDFVCGADVRHALLKYIDVIGVVLPEILPMRGLNQHNPYHIYTVLEHTAVATGLIVQQPVLRMTMLLHDCGKPATYFLDENGRGHCFDHPKVGAQIATEIMERLRYSKDFSQRVITLVANHDAGLEATRKNVRRWMHRLGPDVMHDLLAVKRADVSALAPASREWLPLFDDVEYLMDELISEDACTTLRKLAVNGNDLLTLGMKPGPKIGQILDLLLDDVIDEKIPNERDVLLSNAKLLMNEELPPKETNTGGETTPPR